MQPFEPEQSDCLQHGAIFARRIHELLHLPARTHVSEQINGEADSLPARPVPVGHRPDFVHGLCRRVLLEHQGVHYLKCASERPLFAGVKRSRDTLSQRHVSEWNEARLPGLHSGVRRVFLDSPKQTWSNAYIASCEALPRAQQPQHTRNVRLVTTARWYQVQSCSDHVVLASMEPQKELPAKELGARAVQLDSTALEALPCRFHDQKAHTEL